MTISAIDFGRLYSDHMAATGRRPKTAGAWDARVKEVEPKLAHGSYVEGFISRMDLSGCESLLDVGCGSGALCLPLAPCLRQVTALDYSPAMLAALRSAAEARGLDNIDARLCAWEDDWCEIPECDVVIASRSTQVDDMAAALAKLHAKARRRVYLTHRVGGHALSADILQAIGRRHLALPDYIYVLNILHAMGIHARVDFLEGGRPVEITGLDDLQRRTAWSLGTLDADEAERLNTWYHQRPRHAPLVLPARHWAFISWDKQAG